MDPTTLLTVVAGLAILIILAMVIGVIYVLRQPGTSSVSSVASGTSSITPETASTGPASMAQTLPSTDADDIDTYLAEQRANLGDFALKDLSNSFKGITQDGQRRGIILHINDPDVGLVAFTSRILNPQTGDIRAETTYGKMEVIIRQDRAGLKWEGEPLGILDYTNQRILGSGGQQLLGSMERPPIGREAGYYAIGFFGQKVADITTDINALSTLRWFGDEEGELMPAYQNLVDDLEDNQTLILLGALLLEVGFMDLLTQ